MKSRRWILPEDNGLTTIIQTLTKSVQKLAQTDKVFEVHSSLKDVMNQLGEKLFALEVFIVLLTLLSINIPLLLLFNVKQIVGIPVVTCIFYFLLLVLVWFFQKKQTPFDRIKTILIHNTFQTRVILLAVSLVTIKIISYLFELIIPNVIFLHNFELFLSVSTVFLLNLLCRRVKNKLIITSAEKMVTLMNRKDI